MQKFSLSDVTYKTAEALTIFNTQFFFPPAPSSTPSKPQLKLIMEVLQKVVYQDFCVL